MKFPDLLALKYDPRSDVIDRGALAERLPDTPEVALEVYSDHGRKGDFQEQYEGIEISRLRWERVELTARDLLDCSIFPGFSEWVDTVAHRIEDFAQDGWSCIDVLPEVVKHWQEHRTWLVLPVFLDHSLIPQGEGLHIMEGHTRLGILRGLVDRGIVAASTRHWIWRGAF